MTYPTHHMRNKTPEERRAIAAKSHATRRANREAMRLEQKKFSDQANRLIWQIDVLEERLSKLQHMETMNVTSSRLTGKSLLREEEIARAALPYIKSTGVYFLLDGDHIVYVGQSVNIYARIAEHDKGMGKKFDRFAFVPCEVEKLNKLESLYIHCLRPILNGNQTKDSKCAPMSLAQLLEI